MTTEMRPEQAIDTELAALFEQQMRAEQDAAIACERIHSAAGDKRDYNTRERAWGMSLAQAIAAENFTYPYIASDHAHGLDDLAAAREMLRDIEDEIDELDAQYTGWTRFFIVAGGHIHSSQNCSSCHLTTRFGWLPQLSGLTERDAVADQGSLLCTFCYPSAPVEWTNGREIASAQAKAERAAARDAKKAAAAAKAAARHYVIRFTRPDGSTGTHTERMTLEQAERSAKRDERDYGGGWKFEAIDLNAEAAS